MILSDQLPMVSEDRCCVEALETGRTMGLCSNKLCVGLTHVVVSRMFPDRQASNLELTEILGNFREVISKVLHLTIKKTNEDSM